MIKLNIQRFGHTNSTTNYELPQFIGTDKPQWLTDINQAFLAIDTNLYSASSSANLANTSIGTLSDLTTTAKTNVVSAINEVDSDLGTLSTTVANHTIAIGDNTTAIGTLANLSTTAKTDLVSAVNEVDNIATTNANSIGTLANLETFTKTDLVNAINELVNKFNLVNFETYGSSELAFTDATYYTGNFKIASNSDYSVLKFYGNVQYNPTAYLTYIRIANVIPSGYRPSSDITINGLCSIVSPASTNGQANCEVTFKTDGSIEMPIANGANSGTVGITVHPCLLFLKDFGDTPAPTP